MHTHLSTKDVSKNPTPDIQPGLDNRKASTPVSNGRRDRDRLKFADQELEPLPSLEQIESHFRSAGYDVKEAGKFFSHYKALGWKIQGKTPIHDWQSLVEKWMLNAAQWATRDSKERMVGQAKPDIESIYKLFVSGQRIYDHITNEHFNNLKLSLSDEIMKAAIERRIKQVAGTNEYSLTQLWNAYLKGDEQNELLIKDRSRLISIAIKLAVISYFQHLHQSGNNTLPP